MVWGYHGVPGLAACASHLTQRCILCRRTAAAGAAEAALSSLKATARLLHAAQVEPHLAEGNGMAWGGDTNGEHGPIT